MDNQQTQQTLQRKSRVLRDVERLVARGMEVRICQHQDKNDLGQFYVLIHGPAGTPYAEGAWYIRLTVPNDYPIKSPSVGFNERVWHPNICYKSGSVCLNALNHDWSPIYNLEKVTQDLKILLSEPNFDDPLNAEAAKMYQENPTEYEVKVQKVLEESRAALELRAPGELVSRDTVMKKRKSVMRKQKEMRSTKEKTMTGFLPAASPRCSPRKTAQPEVNLSLETPKQHFQLIHRPFHDADLTLSEPDEDSDEYDEDYSEIEFVYVDEEDEMVSVF